MCSTQERHHVNAQRVSNVKHRRSVKVGDARRQLHHRGQLEAVGHVVRMREHDPLGAAGGAPGIEDSRHILALPSGFRDGLVVGDESFDAKRPRRHGDLVTSGRGGQ